MLAPQAAATHCRSLSPFALCSILAELPRSLSEVAMQHGVSPAALEGPVKLDG